MISNKFINFLITFNFNLAYDILMLSYIKYIWKKIQSGSCSLGATELAFLLLSECSLFEEV